MIRSLVLALVLAGTQQPGTQTPADQSLLDAAQRNDMAGVVRALVAGANVDAKTRYEATALLFAARHVNSDMIRLLVESGADLSVEDAFYRTTALGALTGSRQMGLVRYLLDEGAPGASNLLPVAVESDDLELLRSLVTRDDISDSAIAANHAFAVATDKSEAAAILRAGRPDAESPFVSLPTSELEGLVGRYLHESTGQSQTTVIGLVGDQLVTGQGSRARVLFATSATTFIAPQMPGTDFRFEREGGAIERLFVTRPGGKDADATLDFLRITESDPESSAPALSSSDRAVAPRDATRPWPSFRGAGASGVGDGQGAVVEWDLASGRNVRWKTPIPGIANSSPVVWGDRVFVSTAISGAGNMTFRTGDYGSVAPVDDLSEHIWKLYALDLESGETVWEREVLRGAPRTKRHQKGSQASSTPVTDGRHVVVLFGTAGVLACYDMDGNLLWQKDLGLLDSGWFYDATVQWGHSSSPIIYGHSVILQVDRQTDSFVAAYGLDDGTELWRTSRDDEIPTWGTPTIATGQRGDELVTNGTTIRGYDPTTGELRWTLGPNSEISIGTPVAGPDLVYVTGGYSPVRPVYAIRPGFAGDLSLERGSSASDAIAWSYNRYGTYIPTPIVYQGLLYTLNTNGVLSAYDAQTGESVYRRRIGPGGAFSASPVAADGRLYFASEDGDVYVVRAGPEYVEVSVNDMDEVVMATPAISDGLIVIRTLGNVYGIGSPPGNDER